MFWFLNCNSTSWVFILNCHVWLWCVFFYSMLPFCLMNPKGEKNSSIQVVFSWRIAHVSCWSRSGIKLQGGITLLISVMLCFTFKSFLCIFWNLVQYRYWPWPSFKAMQSNMDLSPSNRGRLLKMDEASSLSSLSVCLTKKIASLLWRL